jgi:hypothetical protein
MYRGGCLLIGDNSACTHAFLSNRLTIFSANQEMVIRDRMMVDLIV